MLIDVEGGDHISASLFIQKGWSLGMDGVQAGRVRGQSWRLNNSPTAHSINKILPSTYPSVVVGIGFRITTNGLSDGTPNHAILSLLTAAGGAVATISTDASGRIAVSGTAGVVATGTTVTLLNTWYYVELKLIVGTSGSCELHLNGVPGEILSTVGNFGTTNIGRVSMSEPGNNLSDLFLDDLYVQDLTGSAPNNDFLGDVVVETLFPSSDGTHLDWTPVPSGTHFNKVNETVPDGDSTYVSDLTPGDMDTYNVNPLAAVSGTVYGVVTNLYARKDDAAGRQIAPVIREAGADHVGATTIGITTSYLFYRQVWQNDPLGAPWTIASVNSSEYGIKEVT